jgi:MerR family redox-sensitive transcriptional activator SoxR
MPEELTIGEVARRSERSASALRYYESEGLLEPASRRAGRRVYDEAVLDRIALIGVAQAAGFTVAEIRTLLRGFPRRVRAAERWQRFVAAKREELAAKAAELERMRRVLDRLQACDCPDLDACGAAMRDAAPGADR